MGFGDVNSGPCHGPARPRPVMAPRDGARAFGARCDVRDEAEVAEFAARVQREMGAPTIVVNNAGIARFAPSSSGTRRSRPTCGGCSW